MDDLDTLWATAEAGPAPAEGQRIASLVVEASDLEGQIAMAQAMLNDLKMQRFKLLTEALPEAMAQAGVALFRTANGQLEVSVDNHVSGSLPSGDPHKGDPVKRAACLSYIESIGGGGIIKADVVLSYGRDRIETAREVFEEMQGHEGCFATLKEDVHPQTLMAWGRDMLRDPKPGISFEPEKANLWVGRVAKIKETKRG